MSQAGCTQSITAETADAANRQQSDGTSQPTSAGSLDGEQLAQNAPGKAEESQDPPNKSDSPQTKGEQEKDAATSEFEQFINPLVKDLSAKIELADQGKAVDFSAPIKQLSDRLATKSSVGEVQPALSIAQMLEIFTAAENVRPIYDGIEKLADRIQPSDPQAAAQVRAAIKGPLARMKLIGTKPAIEGTTAAGEKFDWSKYKGKVVLLDFWATWCGPCLAELPNVKKAYEKYHGQGFDVVGISLDDDAKNLDAFQEKQKLPWVTLFPTGSERGFDGPLARQFLVDSIPATFLIDRDGKVASISARGSRLEAQLDQLLGAK
ncbi:MAG: TlpA family protein disulfide reductase [Pirellulales bacterium]|nr:TlpA family protein disulfide reductase [Pirellulales bacterium]